MSYNETHFGKIVKLENPNNLTIEELSKSLCNNEGIKELDDEYNWIDQLQESLHNKYFIYKNKDIYEIFDEEMDEDGYILSNKIDDRTIEYKCNFYNGGACFYGEVLEAIIKNNEK